MQQQNGASSRARVPTLTLSAVGVVFGDIGTSPLYTLRVCFNEDAMPNNPASVLGILSLVLWSLLLVVTVKYVLFMMRADNRGEGGILAISSLAHRGVPKRWRHAVVILSLVGASLFYGDGVITPAISVLSAVEGLKVAAPGLDPYIVPLTITVLVGLFLLQRSGTARVGNLFGPIMCLWFVTLAVLGLREIAAAPGVLLAVSPTYAIAFLAEHRWLAFVVLGAVVLSVTGAEALYADMGHFGRLPIRLAWFALVLPALVCNYFGQGALLIRDPAAAVNPFYLLAPQGLLIPLVVLATIATVIASQAVISGAFSLTRQAIQLGLLPRLRVRHTSHELIGQIYIPSVNWTLLAGVVLLVLGFRQSSHLASAYGIAVVGAMTVDSIMVFIVARTLWRWSLPTALAVAGGFLTIDLTFLAANVLKVVSGGWVPLLIAVVVFVLISTWRRGREVMTQKLTQDAMPLDIFLRRLPRMSVTRVKGTAVFMTGNGTVVPHALLHNLKHNKVLHERVVLMTVITEDVPRMGTGEDLELADFGQGFHRIQLHHGFMEDPDVPMALARCAKLGLEFNMMETSFFLSRETFIPSIAPDLPTWRGRIFTALTSIATSATEFFHIPPNRVVELGTQVEI
jgi:KUP system potassium uptake protein